MICRMYIRVVNGALECLSRDLGIAENTALQGKSELGFSENFDYCCSTFLFSDVWDMCVFSTAA